MTRSKMLVINLICWACGVLFVWGGGWLLDRALSEGTLKTVMWWVLIGIAVTVFGGVSRAATRRDDATPSR
jgi:hypothetical protein